MLDFVCIFSIFLEVILTTVIINRVIKFEKKVEEINKKLIEAGNVIVIAVKKVTNIVSKINKIASFVTNKKIWQIKRFIILTIDIIQFIVLIRSLDFSKGLKSINYKNLKKLLFAQALRGLIRNILKNVEKCSL